MKTLTGDRQRNLQSATQALAAKLDDLEITMMLRSSGIKTAFRDENSLIDQMLRLVSASYYPQQVAATQALQKLKSTLERA